MTLLQETDSLKKTPLYDRHVALGAKIADFSGWALPIYYSGILAEHLWVRESCGFFDVSHLGEIRVKGPGAFWFLQYRLTNDMNKLRDKRMLYSILCDEKGQVIDDILVYRESADDHSLIVNAANIEADMDALLRYAPDTLTVRNDSDKVACVAVQGPASERILEQVFGFAVRDMEYYSFKELPFEGEPVWVSRSGYTGEDGFEIFSASALAPSVWDLLMEKGQGAKPAGLGARNTLRLEAGNALYGHEMDRSTTPIEAGLHGAVSFTKEGGFVGRDALIRQKEAGTKRRLVAFRMLDKPVPRENYALLNQEGKKIGRVTSGSFGPSVGTGIGLGFVAKGFDTPGTRIGVEIHGSPVPAEVVKTPFVPTRHKRSPHIP